MRLAALQRAFQDHVLDRGDVAGEVTPGSLRGLPVYHHAYRATLRDALRDAFARTAAWLGDARFDPLADGYASAHPPSSWTLGDYGGGFPAFLEGAHPDEPELAELAWLEWSLRAAFSAADAPGPDVASLARLDWERVGVVPAAHVAARTVSTDVAGVWHAMGEERAPDGFELAAPVGLVVWRSDLSPMFRTTSVDEADALALCVDGSSFSRVCAELSERHGQSAGDVGAMLASWLRDGLVADVR